MMGFSAVTSMGFLCNAVLRLSRLTSNVAIALFERSGTLLLSKETLSSKLLAIKGSITFSSKLPDCPAMVIAASLPMTCAATIATASGITGLTLPGMIEEPG